MYAYRLTDQDYGVYTVGHYTPQGAFYAESEFNCRDEAADRVAYLNGGGLSAASIINDLKGALLEVVSYIQENGSHDGNCDILTLDDDGCHRECSCGLDETIFEARKIIARYGN